MGWAYTAAAMHPPPLPFWRDIYLLVDGEQEIQGIMVKSRIGDCS